MAFSFFKSQKKKSSECQERYVKSLHEKYKPNSLDDIIGQSHITNALKMSIKGNDMPHLLFHGPSGTGKSSTIKMLCKELYGSSNNKDYVLELNASDERGIGVVRDKIKNFAQFGSKRRNDVRFKIIILDEADNITDDAQTALRRTMETYSKATRFCLICNQISNINAPLISRCAVFRFKRLLSTEIEHFIKSVTEKENIKFTNQSICLKKLIETGNGDLRKILIQLEILKKLFTEISVENIAEFSLIIPHQDVKLIMESRTLGNLLQYINDILLKGYSSIQLLYQIQDYILNPKYRNVDEFKKLKILEDLSVCEYRIRNGSDELIQISNVIAGIII